MKHDGTTVQTQLSFFPMLCSFHCGQQLTLKAFKGSTKGTPGSAQHPGGWWDGVSELKSCARLLNTDIPCDQRQKEPGTRFLCKCGKISSAQPLASSHCSGVSSDGEVIVSRGGCFTRQLELLA